MRVPTIGAVAAAMLCASCIEGDERVVVERDGAGRAVLTYRIPTAAVVANGGVGELRRAIEDWLDGEKQLDIEVLEITRDRDRTQIHAEVSFRSALSLVDLAKPEELGRLPAAARGLVGTIDFRLQGREFEFTRTIRPQAALGAGILLASRQELETSRLVYRLSLPVAPSSHNATSTADGGRTLVWDIPLADALAAPPALHCKARMPPPWAVLAGVVVGALLLAGVAVAWAVRTGRKNA